VVPAVTKGDARTFYWIVVVEVPEDENQGGDSIYTQKPILRAWPDFDPDMIGRFLKDAGFPLNEAEWTHNVLSDISDEEAPDEVRRNLGLNVKWTWPHHAFRDRQQWKEYTRWWTLPMDSPGYSEGRARMEQENAELLKRFPCEPVK
jgi:hypothetical protein